MQHEQLTTGLTRVHNPACVLSAICVNFVLILQTSILVTGLKQLKLCKPVAGKTPFKSVCNHELSFSRPNIGRTLVGALNTLYSPCAISAFLFIHRSFKHTAMRRRHRSYECNGITKQWNILSEDLPTQLLNSFSCWQFVYTSSAYQFLVSTCLHQAFKIKKKIQ